MVDQMPRNGRTELAILTRAPIALVLGGQTHQVVPRTIKANRDWKELVQRSLGEKFGALDGIAGVEGFYAYLSDSVDVLVDLVVAYDQAHGLPAREWIEDNASDHEVLEAFMVLTEHAFPFFEMGRRFLPGDVRGIIVTRLLEAVLTSGLPRSTSTSSQSMDSTTRPRSKRR